MYNVRKVVGISKRYIDAGYHYYNIRTTTASTSPTITGFRDN